MDVAIHYYELTTGIHVSLLSWTPPPSPDFYLFLNWAFSLGQNTWPDRKDIEINIKITFESQGYWKGQLFVNTFPMVVLITLLIPDFVFPITNCFNKHFFQKNSSKDLFDSTQIMQVLEWERGHLCPRVYHYIMPVTCKFTYALRNKKSNRVKGDCSLWFSSKLWECQYSSRILRMMTTFRGHQPS